MIHDFRVQNQVQLDIFHSKPLSLLPAISQKMSIKEKLTNLRQRMSNVREQIQTIQHEQQEMHQTADNIQKEQENIKSKQIVVYQKQEKVRQNVVVIQKDQAMIRLNLNDLKLKCSDLFQKALNIKQDQMGLFLKFQGIEQKCGEVMQRASVIRQNHTWIRQTLQVAGIIENHIQEIALSIQRTQAAIELEVDSIERKKVSIYQRLPLLNLAGIEQQEKDRMPQIPEKIEEKNVKEIGNQPPSSFWSRLLEKIRNIGFHAIAAFSKEWAAKLFITKDYQWSHLASFVAHPANRIMLEILACAAIQNIKFCYLCIVIEGLVLNFRRNSHFSLFGITT